MEASDNSGFRQLSNLQWLELHPVLLERENWPLRRLQPHRHRVLNKNRHSEDNQGAQQHDLPAVRGQARIVQQYDSVAPQAIHASARLPRDPRQR